MISLPFSPQHTHTLSLSLLRSVVPYRHYAMYRIAASVLHMLESFAPFGAHFADFGNYQTTDFAFIFGLKEFAQLSKVFGTEIFIIRTRVVILVVSVEDLVNAEHTSHRTSLVSRFVSFRFHEVVIMRLETIKCCEEGRFRFDDRHDMLMNCVFYVGGESGLIWTRMAVLARRGRLRRGRHQRRVCLTRLICFSSIALFVSTVFGLAVALVWNALCFEIWDC